MIVVVYQNIFFDCVVGVGLVYCVGYIEWFKQWELCNEVEGWILIDQYFGLCDFI